MPNHVKNEITASPDILDFMRSEESEFDFNRIIPMPEVLKCEPSCNVIDWAKIATGKIKLDDLNKPTPDPLEAFKRNDFGAATERLAQSNLVRLLLDGPFPKDFSEKDWNDFISCQTAIRTCGGLPSWYEWSIKHWGTKWNAYDVSRKNPRLVTFQTAWSMPKGVILAMEKKFMPCEPIRIRWADEDFGHNVGSITITSDGVYDGPLEGGSIEAETLALELLYDGVLDEGMKYNESGHIVWDD